MKYIDIHAHLNFSDFDSDRAEVIARTLNNDMGVINIGTNLATSEEAINLAEQNQNFYASVGIHPTDFESVKNVEETYESLKKLVQNKKVVAIGECGLDYFRIDTDVREHKEKQKAVFEMQIKLAMETGKPLMIHCRDAYFDVIEILKKYKARTQDTADDLFGQKLTGNVHFFAGNINEAKEIIALDFTVSFTGVITFAPQFRELVDAVPLEKMHAETDSPFVAPAPFRGQRNEPLYTIEVIRKISEIKNIPIDTVSSQLLENARKLFGIDTN